MNAFELVKKLSSKLLGKKMNTPVANEYGGGLANITSIAPEEDKDPLVLDGFKVIQLPEHWRN
jgi:hypothetical protein